MLARARTSQCRWSTRGVRPRSALAKAAVLRTVSFLPTPLCALCAEVWGADLAGGARGACAPVRHSQKRLAPMALLDLFSYACARASTARDGALARWSTQGVRPLWALAKAAVLRTDSFSFVLTLLRLRRRQCGHAPPGGARGACAPVRHSQKQPCCALTLFHLCTLLYACGVGSVHK